MSRGNPLVEALLDAAAATSPAPNGWRATCCRPATAGCSASPARTARPPPAACWRWILEHAGLAPGFLIGGVPLDFDVSARLGGGRHFVIEADEYDTAFFDKRAKFVHYRPRTAILNNLEHDHADIYPDVASIQRQFHLLLRTVPRQWPADRQRRGAAPGRGAATRLLDAGRALQHGGDAGRATGTSRRCRARRGYAASRSGAARAAVGTVELGHAGPPQRGERAGGAGGGPSCRGRRAGRGSRRCGASAASGAGWRCAASCAASRVYDDFAHHPTAIATTLDGVRRTGDGAAASLPCSSRARTR